MGDMKDNVTWAEPNHLLWDKWVAEEKANNRCLLPHRWAHAKWGWDQGLDHALGLLVPTDGQATVDTVQEGELDKDG